MTDKEIEAIALANGFVLKEQYGGTMALRPYVFEFARALLAAAAGVEPVEPLGKKSQYQDERGRWYDCQDNDLECYAERGEKTRVLYIYVDQPILYTRPAPSKLVKAAEGAYKSRLEEVLEVVRRYLPPDGISEREAVSEIIGLVDPMPPAPEVEPFAWMHKPTGVVFLHKYFMESVVANREHWFPLDRRVDA